MRHGKLLLFVSSVAVAVLFFVLVVFTAFAPSRASADELSSASDVNHNFTVSGDPMVLGDFYIGTSAGGSNFIVTLDEPVSNVSFDVSFFILGQPYVWYEYLLNGAFAGNFKTGGVESGNITFRQNIPYQFDGLRIWFEPNNSEPYVVLLSAFCTIDHSFGYYNSSAFASMDYITSSAESMSQALIDSAYDNGFAAGKDSGLASQLANPVSFFIPSVDSFMNVDIFGKFSLGDIFSVVLFVCIALIFVKMFAGG